MAHIASDSKPVNHVDPVVITDRRLLFSASDERLDVAADTIDAPEAGAIAQGGAKRPADPRIVPVDGLHEQFDREQMAAVGHARGHIEPYGPVTRTTRTVIARARRRGSLTARDLRAANGSGDRSCRHDDGRPIHAWTSSRACWLTWMSPSVGRSRSMTMVRTTPSATTITTALRMLRRRLRPAM
jgi:hypothetical protein